jgi:hypothetical protein
MWCSLGRTADRSFHTAVSSKYSSYQYEFGISYTFKTSIECPVTLLLISSDVSWSHSEWKIFYQHGSFSQRFRRCAHLKCSACAQQAWTCLWKPVHRISAKWTAERFSANTAADVRPACRASHISVGMSRHVWTHSSLADGSAVPVCRLGTASTVCRQLLRLPYMGSYGKHGVWTQGGHERLTISANVWCRKTR